MDYRRKCVRICEYNVEGAGKGEGLRWSIKLENFPSKVVIFFGVFFFVDRMCNRPTQQYELLGTTVQQTVFRHVHGTRDDRYRWPDGVIAVQSA